MQNTRHFVISIETSTRTMALSMYHTSNRAGYNDYQGCIMHGSKEDMIARIIY
jgi:hypothetical protein